MLRDIQECQKAQDFSKNTPGDKSRQTQDNFKTKSAGAHPIKKNNAKNNASHTEVHQNVFHKTKPCEGLLEKVGVLARHWDVHERNRPEPHQLANVVRLHVGVLGLGRAEWVDG